MSTELATRDETAIERFPIDKVELLKRTICKGTTDDELELFIHACKRTGLDPFMKQIHAVKRWDKKAGREVMSIQTGIDGYRLIADRSGKYAGNDDPVFQSDDKGPYQATVTVYKLVGGIRCPFTATARWDEYYPGDQMGFMWKKMPHVMLGKVAEALALRKAFPAELSGLYTMEEMEQAGPPADVKDAPEPKQADPIADDKQFKAAVGSAFKARGFTLTQQGNALAAWREKQGISTATAADLDARHKLIDAIVKGAFDKFKAPKEEAAV